MVGIGRSEREVGNATANNSTHNARKSEGRNDRAKAREGKAREKERKTGEKEGEGTDSTDGRGTDGIGEKCEFVCGLATSSLSPAFAVVLEGKRASEGQATWVGRRFAAFPHTSHKRALPCPLSFPLHPYRPARWLWRGRASVVACLAYFPSL